MRKQTSQNSPKIKDQGLKGNLRFRSLLWLVSFDDEFSKDESDVWDLKCEIKPK